MATYLAYYVAYQQISLTSLACSVSGTTLESTRAICAGPMPHARHRSTCLLSDLELQIAIHTGKKLRAFEFKASYYCEASQNSEKAAGSHCN